MAVNPAFLVAAVDLSEVFLDKDTGAPLSGGQVSFFEDVDHVTPKLVYTIQNNNPMIVPPAYSYIPLPDPITLSATGQFQDNAGNNIPVYYYPVDVNGNLQLYYIVVTNSNGVQQFTRQAWPPNETTIQPGPGNASGISNQIANGQFLNINFVPAVLTIPYSAAASPQSVAIAPGWNLNIVSTGNGMITVTRTAIAGSAGLPNNPPYTLTIDPNGGANLTSLQLVQTFYNNPNVFAPAAAIGGYISASILLAPNSPMTTITYMPDTGPSTPILTATNPTGNWNTYNATVQLMPAANPSTGDTGYVNIVIGLTTTAVTRFSNVQIVPLNANTPNIPYEATTSNQQENGKFYYYLPLLSAKPIPSYLVGWDFPLNPTQVSGNGTIGAQATGGAAGSFQAWDQTVIFQSVTNGVTISRSALGNGAMRITANAAAVQFAVIQYLPVAVAREILQNPLSSQITALTNRVAGLGGTISLWYTTNGALPSTAANASLVTTLDVNGHPNAVVAGWVEVPRGNLGNAQFTIANSANANFNDHGFSFWNLNGAAATNTANWFAIVVGFSSFSNVTPDTIDLEAISLVPGNIPTRPAPKTKPQTLLDCNQFYWSTFPPGTAPAQNTGINNGCISYLAQFVNPTNQAFAVYVPFPVYMNTAPAMTAYSPQANTTNWWDETFAAASGVSLFNLIGQRGFLISNLQTGGEAIGDILEIHASADSRLGL